MSPAEQKQVLDLLDVRVTVIEHAKKTAGGRLVAPAQIKIEGFVSDLVLGAADDSARDLDETMSRSA